MDTTVIDFNVEHFRRLLAADIDEPTRQALLRLLAAEEAKLAPFQKPPKMGEQSQPVPPLG